MLNTKEVKRLYSLAKQDDLDFSPEFINRFSSRNPEVRELKSAVNKYLTDKLAAKSNIPTITLPWSEMKVEYIPNWPSDMKFKPVSMLNTKEVRRLYSLAKQDDLDFSPEFIKRFSSRNPEVHELKTAVTKYLTYKLARKLKVSGIRIPWSDIKAGDIINWPSDVKLMSSSLMNSEEVKSLYSLAKKDLLDFSPGLIDRLRERQSSNKG
jgi:hypothetical protein